MYNNASFYKIAKSSSSNMLAKANYLLEKQVNNTN